MTNKTKNNLEDLNLKFIEKRTGRVKSIKWSESWDDNNPTKDQLDYVKALASAQNEALELIQNERNDAYAEIVTLSESVKSAQQAYDIQKMINTKAITDSNERINALVTENKELVAQVKNCD